METSDALYAVVTGDIVGSSRLADAERARLHRVLTLGSKTLQNHYPGQIPYAIDIFRGDAWQLLLKDPSLALRAGLAYRVYIRVGMQSRRVDTRMGIGVGRVSYLPAEGGVSSADGEAFRLSGEALEGLGTGKRMAFLAGEALSEELSQAFDVIVQLIDVLAFDWTVRQAQAVAGALWGWTQERIGGSWPQGAISQQAVGQHLDRAGWEGVESALTFFEHTLKGYTVSKEANP